MNAARAALVAFALGGQLGCAGHEVRVEAALQALDRGRADEAIGALNVELGVETADELPALDGDAPLLLLDRATLLQGEERYALSQRDFGAADKAIEVLDLSRGAADDLGRYLFSDDVGPYRAPAFEKLLINSFNMMNYLARGDLQGARVEARRLAVTQKYLRDSGDVTSLVGIGSYLAGFTFEKSGDAAVAARYYAEAEQHGPFPPSEPLAENEAELLVVIGYGRVPPKEPVRLPIGLALTLVSGNISPRDHRLATELATKGLVTWVNFPRLGKARGRYEIPGLWLDDRPAPLAHALDIEHEVRKQWEAHEGTVVLAAITRMIARFAAGEAVQAGANAAAGDAGGGILGLLAGLATTATLAATDTPDTRSWVTLPSNLALARLRIPAGRHTVRVHARGIGRTYRVDTRPGDWRVIVMHALR